MYQCRILLLVAVAAALAACAGIVPSSLAKVAAPLDVGRNHYIHVAQTATPDSKVTTAKPSKRGAKPTSIPEASSETNDSLYKTTPNVGSPEWKREQEEDARKEQHLKKIIEGICRGC